MTQHKNYWYHDSKNNTIYINLKVKASAKSNKISGILNINTKYYLSISTNSAPENNKANKAIIKLLAEWLEIPIASIMLTYGLKHQLKTVKLIVSNITSIISKLNEHQH